MDPAHPHDSLFRLAFGEPGDAESLLRTALPAAVAGAIDWTTLRRVDGTFVDSARRDAESDLLFAAQCGGGDLLLYLLLEHKSRADSLTVFQMLRYVVAVWERHLSGTPACPQPRRRRRPLPPILPIVFHHGRRPWHAPRQLAQLIDIDDLAPAVRRFVAAHQAALRIIVDDVADLSDDALAARSLSLVARVSILFLRNLRDAGPHDLERHLFAVRGLLTRLLDDPRGNEMLAALFFYAVAVTDTPPEQVRSVLYRVLEPTTPTKIMNALQKWFLQERTEGRVEGRAEGQTAGRVEVLQRQLARRFGPLPAWVGERLAATSPARLDTLCDRVLDAPSLDAVFAD